MNVYRLSPKSSLVLWLLSFSHCLKDGVRGDTSLIEFGTALVTPGLKEDSSPDKDCDSSEEMKISSLCSSESEESEEIEEPSAMPLAYDLGMLLNDPMGLKEPMHGALLDDAGNLIHLDRAFDGNLSPFGSPLNSNAFPPEPPPMGSMMDDPYQLPARVVNLGGSSNPGLPFPSADLLQGTDPSSAVLYDIDMGGGVPMVVLKDDPLARLFANLDHQINQQPLRTESVLAPTISTVTSAPVLLDIVKRDKQFV